MLIKNKDNQVEIIGTWKKETNKETTLTVKVNDNIIFQKDISSNEYINIIHDLENGENDITISESYKDVPLKKIEQKIESKALPNTDIGNTYIENDTKSINLTQEIYNSKQVKINFKELYKNYNIEKIQATVDQKDFNDLIVVSNGDIVFNFDYEITNLTFININIDIVPIQENYLVNEVNIKIDDIEIVKQITLNNEKTPVEKTEEKTEEQLTNETQTSIQAPAFEKTGINEGINFFAGLIVTCLLIITAYLILKKENND
jgi:hypothetical protein